MTLPSSNITISLVKNTISSPSSKLTELISLAKTGGTNGLAFNSSGYLYSGAEPYWNMWANKIPARWVLGETDLILQKRIFTTGIFEHRLGDFRQYNHTAQKPSVYLPTIMYVVNGVINSGVALNLYEWNLPEIITHIKVVVTIDGNDRTVIAAVNDINYLAETINAYELQFTGVPSYLQTGTGKVYASDYSGYEYADITNLLTGNSTITFTLNHSSNYATLSKMIATEFNPNITLNASIFNIPGVQHITIPSGTTILPGYDIKIEATSTVYSSFTFDLYLTQTGQSDLYIGSYYGNADNLGYNNYVFLTSINLNAAVSSGDNLGFYMANITY